MNILNLTKTCLKVRSISESIKLTLCAYLFILQYFSYSIAAANNLDKFLYHICEY